MAVFYTHFAPVLMTTQGASGELGLKSSAISLAMPQAGICSELDKKYNVVVYFVFMPFFHSDLYIYFAVLQNELMNHVTFLVLA